VATIHTPPSDVGDLLRQMLRAFGVLDGETREVLTVSHAELLSTLHKFLRSLAPLNAQAVVVFHEAQRLNPDVIEQIRQLSNFQTDGDHQVIQIILVKLDGRLASKDLRQVAGAGVSHGAPVRVRIDKRSARMAVVTAMILAAAFLLWMRDAVTSVAAGPYRPSSGETRPAETTVPVMPPPAAIRRLQDASLQELLDRAAVLERQPNVRALQQVSDEIVRRRHDAPQDTSATFEAALARVDSYLAEARRRQLEVDGRRLRAMAR